MAFLNPFGKINWKDVQQAGNDNADNGFDLARDFINAKSVGQLSSLATGIGAVATAFFGFSGGDYSTAIAGIVTGAAALKAAHSANKMSRIVGEAGGMDTVIAARQQRLVIS